MNDTVSYVLNFIDSLCLPCECKKLAKLLFLTEEDCNDFYIGYLNRNSNILDDLLDFREDIITRINMSLDDFLYRCENDFNVATLESTFYQPVTEQDFTLISSAIRSGRLTLERLFTRFKSNINENIIKNVL